MDVRAQGAMEYLMSYGWAILVIMAVGGAMWQLGILDVGGSIPPTAAGFQALKPLMPTCEMRNDVWISGTYNGFTCQFVNGAGGEILIKDVNVTVDGKYCNWPLVDVVPTLDWGKSFILYRGCDDISSTCTVTISQNLPAGTFCAPANVPSCYIPIANGGQFSVFAFTPVLGDGDPCSDIIDGKVYTVDVDIAYEINVGGVPTTKGSSGKIRLPGKE